MGFSYYSSSGPAVTLKTWGQGPGGPTALYQHNGCVRRLSPFEALRMHSFSDETISLLKEMWREGVLSWEDLYRMAGNSIPVGMLSEVIRSLLTVVEPQMYWDRMAGN